MGNPLEDYMSNRRRDQEEAWYAGADAMLDGILKEAQKHIDKTAGGTMPGLSKAIHEAATAQYRRGIKVMEANPFTIAKASKVKAPELPVVNVQPTIQREPGTAERE